MPAARPMVLVLLLVGASLGSGCFSTSSDPTVGPADQEAASPPRPNATTFRWRAEGYSGSLAVQLTLDALGTGGRCRGGFNITGNTAGRDALIAVVMDHGGDAYSARTSTRQSGIAGEQYAQVQGAGVVHQRSQQDSLRWTATAGTGMLNLEPGRPVNLTFAGVGLSPANGQRVVHGSPTVLAELGNASALVWLSCSENVRIAGFGGSAEAWLFDEAALRGGLGIHAAGGLEVTGVNVANKFTRRVASPAGLLFVYIGGDLLLNHVGVGVVQITYPGGSDMMVDRPRQVLVEATTGLLQPRDWERMYRAGPGVYEITATYASLDSMGLLRGGIVGITPLESLDEMLRDTASRPSS